MFKLIFSDNPLKLKKWVIVDEFDNETSVLQNLIIGKKYSHILFFLRILKSKLQLKNTVLIMIRILEISLKTNTTKFEIFVIHIILIEIN